MERHTLGQGRTGEQAWDYRGVSEHDDLPSMTQTSPYSGLTVIALFKVVTGLIVLLAGAGFLRLADAGIDTFFSPLMDALHLGVHFRLLHALLLNVADLQHQAVPVMGLVSLSYAALLFVEGFGLWVESSWAAYLTVISMSIMLPGECHAVIRDLSVTGLSVLAVNVLIVGYLVRRLGGQTLR